MEPNNDDDTPIYDELVEEIEEAELARSRRDHPAGKQRKEENE